MQMISIWLSFKIMKNSNDKKKIQIGTQMEII